MPWDRTQQRNLKNLRSGFHQKSSCFQDEIEDF